MEFDYWAISHHTRVQILNGIHKKQHQSSSRMFLQPVIQRVRTTVLVITCPWSDHKLLESQIHFQVILQNWELEETRNEHDFDAWQIGSTQLLVTLLEQFSYFSPNVFLKALGRRQVAWFWADPAPTSPIDISFSKCSYSNIIQSKKMGSVPLYQSTEVKRCSTVSTHKNSWTPHGKQPREQTPQSLSYILVWDQRQLNLTAQDQQQTHPLLVTLSWATGDTNGVCVVHRDHKASQQHWARQGSATGSTKGFICLVPECLCVHTGQNCTLTFS